MATVKATFSNSNAITITLASLTSTSIATSSAIDNSVNLFLEAIVQLKIANGASTTSTTGVINVYLIRSMDGGTTYDDSNKTMIGSIPFASVAASGTATASFSTAPFGNLGTNFKIAVENQCGQTLNATAGNFVSQYTGVTYAVA